MYIFLEFDDQDFELTLRIIYDNLFRNNFGNGSEERFFVLKSFQQKYIPNKYKLPCFFFRINAVMDHVQTLYLIPSLQTRIHFNILSIEFLPNIIYNATYHSLK